MELLISEEMLLLALDDEKGTTWLDGWSALSGALIVDALTAGAVTAEEDRLVAGTEPAHPLLRRVREAVAAQKPRTVADWVWRLHSELKPLLGAVAEPLVERGVLARERGKVLGLFPTTRYPEVDPGPERALRAGLHGVLVEGRAPAGHEALLLALIRSSGLVERLVADEDRDVRKQARRRADELAGAATADPAGAGALAAVAATDAAVSAAVAVALVASTVVIGGSSGGTC